MGRKYFTASIPYDNTVTGLWTELITDYLTSFIEFIADNKCLAVNEARCHLLKTFAAILTQHRGHEARMNLQCNIFPQSARIDIRFHKPVFLSRHQTLIETKHGYQIESALCETKSTPFRFVYRLAISTRT